jgi:hypothetical protein
MTFHSLPEDVAADIGAPWEPQERLSRKQRFAMGKRALPSGPTRTVPMIRRPQAKRKANR